MSSTEGLSIGPGEGLRVTLFVCLFEAIEQCKYKQICNKYGYKEYRPVHGNQSPNRPAASALLKLDWSDDMLAGPLGRYVGGSVSCQTWWSLVWWHSGCKSFKNAVVGIYNTISVVTLSVDI